LPNGSGILLYQQLTGVRLRRIAWSSGWGTSTNIQSFEDVNPPIAVTSNCDVIFYSSMAYKLNATSLGTKYSDPASGSVYNSSGVCFNPSNTVFVKTTTTGSVQSFNWSYASGFGSVSVLSATPPFGETYTPVFFHTGA